MKVPDKIYIREFKGAGLSQVWSGIKSTEENIITSLEYISKGTLIEPLGEKRNAIMECSAAEERKIAALSVIDFLINKIESL